MKSSSSWYVIVVILVQVFTCGGNSIESQIMKSEWENDSGIECMWKIKE